ncbi:hypothetical protein C8F01DRAFT_1377803 [Mycena amicta]|nr:hypothetical protein C8F01DRAFT_1377803 [Mycena amicta]
MAPISDLPLHSFIANNVAPVTPASCMNCGSTEGSIWAAYTPEARCTGCNGYKARFQQERPQRLWPQSEVTSYAAPVPSVPSISDLPLHSFIANNVAPVTPARCMNCGSTEGLISAAYTPEARCSGCKTYTARYQKERPERVWRKREAISPLACAVPPSVDFTPVPSVPSISDLPLHSLPANGAPVTTASCMNCGWTEGLIWAAYTPEARCSGCKTYRALYQEERPERVWRKSNAPSPVPCGNCGKGHGKIRTKTKLKYSGLPVEPRCLTCYVYKRDNGKERPRDLWGRMRLDTQMSRRTGKAVPLLLNPPVASPSPAVPHLVAVNLEQNDSTSAAVHVATPSPSAPAIAPSPVSSASTTIASEKWWRWLF